MSQVLRPRDRGRSRAGDLLPLASVGHPVLRRKEAPAQIDPVPVAGAA